MQDFVHLHVHTQYSILDGQASIPRLVDKAMANGMRGIAVTDHGDMFGIKEFFNYVNKKNGSTNGEIKDLKKKIAALESGKEESENPEAEIAACKEQLEAAKKKLFKPIFGCEMYVARRRLEDKEGKPDQSGYHLVVLAKNLKGYHNLIKLVSKAWTKGFYMRPRTDRAELEKYHEGLIVCSACLGGEVPRRITAGQFEEAEEAIRWYKNLFGDDYYLELQRHKATVARANHEVYPMQQVVNEKLIEYAKKYNIKLVCTNDVHFVDEENAEAHDRLICLSTGKDLDDPNRMLYTKQEWMKTREEMNEVFADVPEALSNTVEICDKVEFYSIDHAPIMPTFAIPEDFGTEEEYRKKFTEKDLFDEFTRDENGNVVMDEAAAKAKIERLGGYEKLYRIKLEADYLAKLAYDGAKRRYGENLSEEVQERIKFELYIMKTMGFPGYFLIVQDFINAARHQLDVSVGPGRGSAAGSAVAYCLGITQIDPIQYDLLFERFLNPDRISLPDIDVDFDDDGRGRVLNWVTEKYGQEKVAHIITYGTMATKLAIKDVARVQKLPLSESDRLCKLIPDKLPDKKLNLPNAIAYVPELQEAEVSPNPVKLINTQLSGQFLTHMSVSFYAGILLASPYILYQLFHFISPALYQNEKKYSRWLIFWGYLLFLTGVLFSYFLIFPFTFRFLSTYQVSQEVENTILLSSYIDTLNMLSLMMGITFEIPILTWLLAKLGILSADFMAQYRKHAWVVAMIIAAIITPTSDVFTMLIVTFPIVLLYEVSIFLVRHTVKKRRTKGEN